MPDSPLTGDVVICSEVFNSAPANSVHLATVGGASPIWKSFGNDSAAIPFSNSYSLELDGVDDYATPDSTFSLTGSKSIAGWFRFNNTSSNTVFGTASSQYGWLFWTSNTIFFRAGGGITFNLTTTLAADTWYHVAFTGNGTHLKCYINGTQEGGDQTDNTWSIGEFFKSGAFYYFDGDVDELALWSGTELSASDVATIANAGAATGSKAIDLEDYTGLTNWWRMGDNNAGTGTTITDVIGGNNLTLPHTIPFTQDTP